MKYDILFLYYFIDEFCKVYEKWESAKLISESTGQKRRQPSLSLSEMLTIMICYHLSGYKCFKYFYLYDICTRHKDKFKNLPSYSRYIQLMPRLFLPLYTLFHMLTGEHTGIYFMDSTSLNVCHNRRINRHKVFKGLAARGKSTMGWFFGFKLHVVINNKGQIVAAKITRGNVNDRNPVSDLTKDIQGIVAADKGYLSKEIFVQLYKQGLKLLTGIRKDMKNYLIPIYDKMILRKRFLVETVFDKLKCDLNINHTRHRSPANAMINWLSALVAYQTTNNKPALKSLKAIQN